MPRGRHGSKTLCAGRDTAHQRTVAAGVVICPPSLCAATHKDWSLHLRAFIHRLMTLLTSPLGLRRVSGTAGVVPGARIPEKHKSKKSLLTGKKQGEGRRANHHVVLSPLFFLPPRSHSYKLQAVKSSSVWMSHTHRRRCASPWLRANPTQWEFQGGVLGGRFCYIFSPPIWILLAVNIQSRPPSASPLVVRLIRGGSEETEWTRKNSLLHEMEKGSVF